MNELNIVELIVNNPITKLSKNYNSKMLIKMKEEFTDFEQQLFVSSFYCYLNYNSKTDFVIDLDNVWKWLEFSTKQKTKELLEKHFIIDKDYIKLVNSQVSQSTSHTGKQTNSQLTGHTKGGHNKITFMITIKTFKSLCLKAGTKKADEIHDYYMKMEEIILDIIHEESNELKQQLEQKTEQLEQKTEQLETQYIDSLKEKEYVVEQTLISQFPVNTQCIYYGKIDNKSLGKETSKMYHEQLIKFGQSNNLAERVTAHKKTFENFILIAAFKVKNKIEIENCMKRHPILKKRIRSLMINDINYRELFALDDNNFTIDKVDDHIKQIIKENEYNIENYNLLVDKNYQLEEQVRSLEKENKLKDEHVIKLTQELQNYKSDITVDNKNKICSNYALCKYGYFLYAFECEPLKYKCSITRQKDYEQLAKNLTEIDTAGLMKYYMKVSYPFSEKIMMFLLKQSLTSLGNTKFEGSFENIKKIIDITAKIEQVLVDNGNNLDKLQSIIDGTGNIGDILCEIDPETPQIKKSKRSIDKIHKDTGVILATYESIEAAGRSLGLTTGTAVGIALREKRVCQGFLWRYSGISKEDQFNEQPVIKICCSTGEKINFKNIADAAKDIGISAPGMRNRIITKVHLCDHHWVFDKTSSHYT